MVLQSNCRSRFPDFIYGNDMADKEVLDAAPKANARVP
jgi:hypothetical protein